jgi:hypothetical protein
MVDFECGQKRLCLAHFQDDPMELVGRSGPAPASARRPEGNFRFQFRSMVLLLTDSNDVGNMACSDSEAHKP